MSKLVTLRSASRVLEAELCLLWPKYLFGVMFVGRVNGFLWSPEPAKRGSYALFSRSRCSIEAGRGWFAFLVGYHPRFGPPANRNNSVPIIACSRPGLFLRYLFKQKYHLSFFSSVYRYLSHHIHLFISSIMFIFYIHIIILELYIKNI